MSTLQRTQICHCGHDKATHFEKQHTCLGMLCECPGYVHEDAPKPVPAKKVPVVEEEKHVDDGWFFTPFGPYKP